MVKLKEPRIGEGNRLITVNGFSDYVNPIRVRISLYSIQMALPENEEGDAVLQLARESELMFDRDTFLKFADRIEYLRKWLEEHPVDSLVMEKEELKKYILENFTRDEILAIWAGHQLNFEDISSFGLIPIISNKNDEM